MRLNHCQEAPAPRMVQRRLAKRPCRVGEGSEGDCRATFNGSKRNGVVRCSARLHPRGASPWRRGWGGDAELADQAEEVGALEAEGAGGVGAIALRAEQRGLDEPALEVADGAVKADRAGLVGSHYQQQRLRHAHEGKRVQLLCRT